MYGRMEDWLLKVKRANTRTNAINVFAVKQFGILNDLQQSTQTPNK